ncbi:hypothetical protein EDB84DRAFT_1551418 [Lactarius hengduanensis]|nr:hypothetical protein EDB84DRAFT_1551418 [Lactarius hengduanensis]
MIAPPQIPARSWLALTVLYPLLIVGIATVIVDPLSPRFHPPKRFISVGDPGAIAGTVKPSQFSERREKSALDSPRCSLVSLTILTCEISQLHPVPGQ